MAEEKEIWEDDCFYRSDFDEELDGVVGVEDLLRIQDDDGNSWTDYTLPDCETDTEGKEDH